MIETLPELKATYEAAKTAMIMKCARQGMTQSEAARKLGISPQRMVQMVSRKGIEWPVKYHADYGKE